MRLSVFFFEDTPRLIHCTVTTVQLPNKTCCLNIKDTTRFFPNNPPPTSYICFSRESGTSSPYPWLPPSLKNLATPVREEHFPPANPLHPESERGGITARFSPGRGHLTCGELKKLLRLCRIGFISVVGDGWCPLLGFLTPAVISHLYKHPLSVLLRVRTNEW